MLTIWVVCGLVAAAALNAEWQSLFPTETYKQRRKDLRTHIAMCLFAGPIALVAATILTGFFSEGFSLSAGSEDE